jgi:DnaK suppressor protein
VATKSSKSTATVSAPQALLTEAEILAMGEKDYMNAAQLAFSKHACSNWKRIC